RDSDDVFLDHQRQRVYVICGQGFVDVFAAQGDGYSLLARTSTVAGARTGLFVPQLDRLFVAARAADGNPATVWVFQPGCRRQHERPRRADPTEVRKVP